MHQMVDVQPIFDIYPQMRAALQPAERPFEAGTWHFCPEQDYLQLMESVNAGQFTLRVPSESTDGLCALRGYGDCLSPLLQDGDVQLFDPSIEPQDGDFVLVSWGERGYAEVLERAGRRWRERFGTEPPRIVTKRLRRLGSSWLLVTNLGHFNLHDNQILGVLRKVLRGKQALYEAPGVSMMQPNAATSIYADELIGPTTYIASASTVYVPAIVNFTADTDGVVQATATCDASTMTPMVGAIMRLRMSGVGGPVDHADGAFYVDYRRIALQINGAMTAGGLVQIQLEIPNPAYNVTVENVRLRVEAVKR